MVLQSIQRAKPVHDIKLAVTGVKFDNSISTTIKEVANALQKWLSLADMLSSQYLAQ